MTQTCAHFKVKHVCKIHIKLNGEMSVVKPVEIFIKILKICMCWKYARVIQSICHWLIDNSTSIRLSIRQWKTQFN